MQNRGQDVPAGRGVQGLSLSGRGSAALALQASLNPKPRSASISASITSSSALSAEEAYPSLWGGVGGAWGRWAAIVGVEQLLLGLLRACATGSCLGKGCINHGKTRSLQCIAQFLIAEY